MPSSTISRREIKLRPRAYERFIGLETLRDDGAQDTGTKQPLRTLSNGYIDDVGQIVREPGADRIQSANNVLAVAHLDINDIVWTEKRGDGIAAVSSNGSSASLNWPTNSQPTIVPFNNRLLILGVGLPGWEYAGAAFEALPATQPLVKRLRPAFGATVQSRLAVAGMPQYPGIVEISRVNDIRYFSEEERADEESVLRGGKIDIRSMIGVRETITGLHPFETNKLIIFTGDRGLVYRISTDIDEWAIEDRTSISAGCISHKTIAAAGPDVLYCSRTGVHSVMRARENGTMVYSYPMSGNIGLLYRSLLRAVPDVSKVSAVWDRDENQYHIFFPTEAGTTQRLTMTMDMADPRSPRWSLASGLLAGDCGHFFEGSLVFGSSDALYQIGKIEEDFREFNPDLVIETPTLFLGSFTDPKSINGLIISAAGNAELLIEAIAPDTDKVFWSKRVEVSNDSLPELYRGTPLKTRRQIPFQTRTTSMRLRITAKGKGLFRLAGFAFLVEE